MDRPVTVSQSSAVINKNASSTGRAEEALGLARTLLLVSQTLAVASSVAVPYHHQQLAEAGRPEKLNEWRIGDETRAATVSQRPIYCQDTIGSFRRISRGKERYARGRRRTVPTNSVCPES
jgi:hypothetical protein